MPLIITSILSALVLTYAVSRLFLRLLGSIAHPTLRLISAHVLAWLALAAAIGFVKAYFTSFAYAQTAVLIAPQLLWLLLDMLRGLGDRPNAYGISTRGNRSR